MTSDEIDARLAELDDEIADYEAELSAARFLQMINYLEAEGFIEIDGEHIYPVGEPWSPA